MEFYFYDLETTGLNPLKDRIMQFGGQRLNQNLEPLSEIDEFYIKLSEDVIPAPQAIAVHKILPQTANLEGLTEYQFVNWLEKNVYISKTIYSGYNIDNFDNKFMHWLHWRNFSLPAPMTEPAKSFDIYKLARLASDLRPEGIKWHKDPKTKKLSLKLGNVTKINKVTPTIMHSAAGDTIATIEVAKLIKQKQSKLFDHYLQLLKPDFVKQIVSTEQPFLYNTASNLAFGSSTTLATIICEHPTEAGLFIAYDLRQPIDKLLKLDDYDLSLALMPINRVKDPMPLSIIDINKVPVVAPITVLDQRSAQRLKLQKTAILENLVKLQKTNFNKTVEKAYLRLINKMKLPPEVEFSKTKVSKSDQSKIDQIKQTKSQNISELDLQFDDPRFKHLQFLYQARNFPKTLKTDQLLAWEKYRKKIFFEGKPSGLDSFKQGLQRSLSYSKNDAEVINLFEELQLYIESIIPRGSLS